MEINYGWREKDLSTIKAGLVEWLKFLSTSWAVVGNPTTLSSLNALLTRHLYKTTCLCMMIRYKKQFTVNSPIQCPFLLIETADQWIISRCALNHRSNRSTVAMLISVNEEEVCFFSLSHAMQGALKSTCLDLS